MNMDGAVDLVLGQLRRPRNQQEGLASRVLLNDGSGHFSSARVVDLPYPSFFEGWTYVRSIEVGDINGDGFPDLMLSHTSAQDDTKPDEPIATGRYIQALVNRDGAYVDETSIWIGDQSATTIAMHPSYGQNRNAVHGIRLLDINGDGVRDLFMGEANGPVGHHAPLVHLNDGRGVFRVLEPDLITERQTWFGENAFALHLNGDDLIDFIHSDLLPGPDGQYNTGDEHSRLIATLAVRR
jgi:hypothetical protein